MSDTKNSPKTLQPQDSLAAANLLAEVQQTTPERERPPRVVLLDDEQIILDCYEAFIEILFPKIEVLKFRESVQALDELSRTAPDLLIMDLNRPGMSGWVMLRLLAERQVKYPILVVSGNLCDKKAEAKQCAGPHLKVAFISKPWLHEEMYKELAVHFGASNEAECLFKQLNSSVGVATEHP